MDILHVVPNSAELLYSHMRFSVIHCFHAYDTMHCTMALVLIMEKMLLRIPEQMSSSLCWRRCRWMWCKTTGSRILRDSEGRDTKDERGGVENESTVCTLGSPVQLLLYLQGHKTLCINLHFGLTGEEEEAALNCASNRLQFDHIHRLANVHCAGHAP